MRLRSMFAETFGVQIFFASTEISAPIFLRNSFLSTSKIYNRCNSWHISTITEWLQARFVDDRPLSESLFSANKKIRLLCSLKERLLLRGFFSLHFQTLSSLACFRAFSIYLHVGVIWRLRSIDRAFFLSERKTEEKILKVTKVKLKQKHRVKDFPGKCSMSRFATKIEVLIC